MASRQETRLVEALGELLGRARPGSVVEEVRLLGADQATGEETTVKEIGYGKALRVFVREPSGGRRSYVLHTAVADEFGHDRRSDRAKNMLLAYDTFQSIPEHVPAVDVGTITPNGQFYSLQHAGEFYLLTEFAPGEVYAEDLRRITTEKQIQERDLARCEKLAGYLVSLHSEKNAKPELYRRAIRDLVGDGEGIFGLIDGYPADVPAAAPARLEAIEKLCVDWRWRLRGYEHRLARTHGDFHPFNILFDENDQLALLDASRGSQGDPADDVTCLTINYVFFGLENAGAWQGALQKLWRNFWDLYLEQSRDQEVLKVAPPYLAWRLLVLANPKWYPQVDGEGRDKLLSLAEHTLEQQSFDPESVESLF